MIDLPLTDQEVEGIVKVLRQQEIEDWEVDRSRTPSDAPHYKTCLYDLTFVIGKETLPPERGNTGDFPVVRPLLDVYYDNGHLIGTVKYDKNRPFPAEGPKTSLMNLYSRVKTDYSWLQEQPAQVLKERRIAKGRKQLATLVELQEMKDRTARIEG